PSCTSCFGCSPAGLFWANVKALLSSKTANTRIGLLMVYASFSLFCARTLIRQLGGIARLRQMLIAAKPRRVDARPHVVIGRRGQVFSQLKVVRLRPADPLLERGDLEAETFRLAEIPNVAVAPVARVRRHVLRFIDYAVGVYLERAD